MSLELYDFTMVDTDSMDYRCVRNSYKLKSRCWKIVKPYALNTQLDPLSVDSLSFGMEHVDRLVKPSDQGLNGLQT